VVVGHNIKYLRRARGLTQKELAKRIGVSDRAVSAWELGRSEPLMGNIQAMAEVFSVRKSDIVEEWSDSTLTLRGKRIPILGKIAAGLPMLAEENVEGYVYVDLPSGADYFALRINGDSMDTAHIIDNSLVVIRQQEQVNNGEIAVVMVNGQDATLKYFRHDGTMVTLTPKSFNSKHQTQVFNLQETEVKVIGKLVRVEIDSELLI